MPHASQPSFRILLLLLACTVFARELRAQPPATDPLVTGVVAFPIDQVRAIVAALPRDRAIDSLATLYTALGYLRVGITIDTVRGVQVVEGERYRFGRLALRPDSTARALGAAGIDSASLDGEFFSPGRLTETLDAIVAAINARGFPLAVARVEALGIDDSLSLVEPEIVVAPGDRVVLAEFDVRGNTETSRELIIAAARLKGGELFTDELAGLVRDRLVRLDLFTAVAEPQLYRTDSGAYGLAIEVTEGNPTAIDGILGYQPPERPGEQGSLTGHINISLRNIFGGRRFGGIL